MHRAIQAAGISAAFFALQQICFPGSASAEPVQQIQLSEKQVQSFIAAQKDMEAIVGKDACGDGPRFRDGGARDRGEGARL